MWEGKYPTCTFASRHAVLIALSPVYHVFISSQLSKASPGKCVGWVASKKQLTGDISSELNFNSSLDKKGALKSIGKHLFFELTVEKFLSTAVQSCLLIRSSEGQTTYVGVSGGLPAMHRKV